MCIRDRLDIEGVLGMDVTPLSSISTSGVVATPCPDMSVARSVSVGPGTSMSVDFNDRAKEIQDTVAAMLELADSTPTARARSRSRNPSQ